MARPTYPGATPRAGRALFEPYDFVSLANGEERYVVEGSHGGSRTRLGAAQSALRAELKLFQVLPVGRRAHRCRQRRSDKASNSWKHCRHNPYNNHQHEQHRTRERQRFPCLAESERARCAPALNDDGRSSCRPPPELRSAPTPTPPFPLPLPFRFPFPRLAPAPTPLLPPLLPRLETPLEEEDVLRFLAGGLPSLCSQSDHPARSAADVEGSPAPPPVCARTVCKGSRTSRCRRRSHEFGAPLVRPDRLAVEGSSEVRERPENRCRL